MYFSCFHFGNICLFQVFYTIIPIYGCCWLYPFRQGLPYGVSASPCSLTSLLLYQLYQIVIVLIYFQCYNKIKNFKK